MSKAPAFQFYPAEYLADAKVKLMDFRQKGIYMDLLCHCWLEGSIPAEPELLARMLGIDAVAFKDDWKWIEPCFKVSKKDNTKMIHPRLETEREKQKNFSGKQKKIAEKRWLKEKTEYATALPEEKTWHASGNALQSSSSSSSSEKKKSRCMLRSTDEQKTLAEWIFEKIREMSPNHKPPNLEVWANDIRLMVEQDGRSIDTIKELFSWANRHDFWCKNILSPRKLREKWDQLTIHKSQPGPGNTSVPGNRIVPGEARTAGVLKF